MRSDNLQLPCVQLPTSSYNLELPPGCHGHHGPHGHGDHGDHGGHRGHVGHGVLGDQDIRTGQDRTGQDRTKMTFKLDFPSNL